MREMAVQAREYLFEKSCMRNAWRVPNHHFALCLFICCAQANIHVKAVLPMSCNAISAQHFRQPKRWPFSASVGAIREMPLLDVRYNQVIATTGGWAFPATAAIAWPGQISWRKGRDDTNGGGEAKVAAEKHRSSLKKEAKYRRHFWRALPSMSRSRQHVFRRAYLFRAPQCHHREVMTAIKAACAVSACPASSSMSSSVRRRVLASEISVMKQSMLRNRGSSVFKPPCPIVTAHGGKAPIITSIGGMATRNAA